MQVLRIIAIAAISSISTAIPVNNQHLASRDIGPYQDCTSGDMCADGPFLEVYACCEVPGGNGRTACIRATDCPQNEASRMQSTWQKIGWLRLAITDWKTCQPNGVDTCTNPNFVCCIAPEDASSGKYTCRSKDQCSVNNNSGKTNSNIPGKMIAEWQTCQLGKDTCVNSGYVCCVAPADLGSNKATCRPQKECSSGNKNTPNTPISDVGGPCNQAIQNAAVCRTGLVCNPLAVAVAGAAGICALPNNKSGAGTQGGNMIADWQTCQQGRDTCYSTGFVCCVAQGDMWNNKATCRTPNECSNGNNWMNGGTNGPVDCIKDDWKCGDDKKTLMQCTPSKRNAMIWTAQGQCANGTWCRNDGARVVCA
ncbi:hypothetical protein HDU79_003819 [Rhizoclosmatium sp. JEL0117]|nr:hypothetical protein HDU79_003819 [Rhizoclosmatium sp. JEL0117]